MTETLKTLTGLNNTALGYPPQWVENLRMKIGGDAPFEMGDVVGDKKNFGSVQRLIKPGVSHAAPRVGVAVSPGKAQ